MDTLNRIFTRSGSILFYSVVLKENLDDFRKRDTRSKTVEEK